MKQNLMRLMVLQNQLDTIEKEMHEYFNTKEVLHFEDKTTCLFSIDKKRGEFMWEEDGEIYDTGCGLYEVIEKESYVVVLNDYQQGIDDTYLIFLKSNERDSL